MPSVVSPITTYFRMTFYNGFYVIISLGSLPCNFSADSASSLPTVRTSCIVYAKLENCLHIRPVSRWTGSRRVNRTKPPTVRIRSKFIETILIPFVYDNRKIASWWVILPPDNGRLIYRCTHPFRIVDLCHCLRRMYRSASKYDGDGHKKRQPYFPHDITLPSRQKFYPLVHSSNLSAPPFHGWQPPMSSGEKDSNAAKRLIFLNLFDILLSFFSF